MVRDNLFESANGYIEQSISDLADDSQVASWLVDDVQFDCDFLVEIVDAIASDPAGLDACKREFAGNAWLVVMDFSNISLLNMYVNDIIGARRLSRKDVLAVISQYWQCMIDLNGDEPFKSSVRAFTVSHGHPPVLPWPLDRPLAVD
ncbi:hypothetical protein [Nocardia heshunensis]